MGFLPLGETGDGRAGAVWLPPQASLVLMKPHQVGSGQPASEGHLAKSRMLWVHFHVATPLPCREQEGLFFSSLCENLTEVMEEKLTQVGPLEWAPRTFYL